MTQELRSQVKVEVAALEESLLTARKDNASLQVSATACLSFFRPLHIPQTARSSFHLKVLAWMALPVIMLRRAWPSSFECWHVSMQGWKCLMYKCLDVPGITLEAGRAAIRLLCCLVCMTYLHTAPMTSMRTVLAMQVALNKETAARVAGEKAMRGQQEELQSARAKVQAASKDADNRCPTCPAPSANRLRPPLRTFLLTICRAEALHRCLYLWLPVHGCCPRLKAN